jgi:hypothetical protein
VTQDGGHPIYIFVHPPSLPPLSSFFQTSHTQPLLSLALPLSYPFASRHCLGSRLLLHILYLTSLLLIALAIILFG